MNSRAHRVEGLVLVAILTVVAGFAGAASFTHVKDWTLANSPAGTPAWFGWANAVISELVPAAALLVIRRRRRAGQPLGFPMFLLGAAVALSLAAQLAVAKPGLSGWLLSAVPALAFLGLSKLVVTTAVTPAPTAAAAGGSSPAQPVDAAVAVQADGPVEADGPRPELDAPDRAVLNRAAAAPVPRPAVAVLPIPPHAFTRVNGAQAPAEVTR